MVGSARCRARFLPISKSVRRHAVERPLYLAGGSESSGEGMEAQAMTDCIRSLIRDHARLGIDVAKLEDGADLYAAGMTSHASVNVMLAVENAFDLEFPDRLLKRSTFRSIDDIRAAVVELTAAPR